MSFVTEYILISSGASASVSSRKKSDILELIKAGLRCLMYKDLKKIKNKAIAVAGSRKAFWKEVTHVY